MAFYGTATLFKSYHTSRGRTIPVAWSDAVIEAGLLVASEWLDIKYDNLWIGYKTSGYTQAQGWPRTNAQVQVYPYYIFTNAEIPTAVTNAVYEITFKHLTDSTVLQKDYTPAKYRTVAVQGAVSVEYNSALTVNDVQTEFAVVNDLMSDLIDGNAEGSYSPLTGSLGRG